MRNTFAVLFGESIYQSWSHLPLTDQRNFFVCLIRFIVSCFILSCEIFSHYFSIISLSHIKIFFSGTWSNISYVLFTVRVEIKRLELKCNILFDNCTWCKNTALRFFLFTSHNVSYPDSLDKFVWNVAWGYGGEVH
jgi:hypothetical protein